MLEVDADDRFIDASVNEVEKHHAQSTNFENSTDDNKNNDKNKDDVIRRLLSAPLLNVSLIAIDTEELVVMSVDCNSDRAQKKIS